MKRKWSYLQDVFVITTNKNRKKMLIIATDHVSRLEQKSGDADIMILYNRTLPVQLAYAGLFSDWRNRKAAYEGSTLEFENKMHELANVKAHTWMARVGVVFVDSSPQYRAIFPNQGRPFYQGSYEERINEVDALAKNMLPYTQLNAVRTDVTNYYQTLINLRNNQQNDESALDNASQALELQRIVLGKMLYANLGALMQKYADDPSLIEPYFDLELIRSKSSKDDDEQDKPLVLITDTPANQLIETGFVGLSNTSVLIVWGDSSSTPVTFTSSSSIFINHQYIADGIYTMKIYGGTYTLTAFHSNNSNLTDIDLESAPNLTEIILQNNKLSQQSSNKLVIQLAKNGKLNGTLNMLGGSNAAPDISIPEVAEAMNLLRSRGWMILTN